MAVEQPGKCNKNITRRSNGQFSKAASVPLGPRRHASEETVAGEISGPTPLIGCRILRASNDGKPCESEGSEVSEAQGYHPNNLKLQPYDHERLIELTGHAVRLGIQFHVGGIPFGAPYNRELWEGFNVESSFPRAQGDGDQAHAPEQGSAQLGGPPGAIVGGS